MLLDLEDIWWIDHELSTTIASELEIQGICLRLCQIAESVKLRPVLHELSTGSKL